MTNSSVIPATTNDRFLYVFISFGLVLAVLFFSADDVLGAVGLRAWYYPVGMVAATASLFLIPFALFYRRFSRQDRNTYLALMVLLMIVAFGLRQSLILVGWFTGIATGVYWIPASTVAIVFTILLVIQFILSYQGTKVEKPIARWLIIAAWLYSVGYFFGFAALPAYAEAEISDRMTYDDHLYFLYIRFGWLGDPDYLALYECNQFGLVCKVTYQAPTGHYYDRQLAIEIDSQTQTVGVKIDDLFSPHELTEADVAYLCAFFGVTEEDPFCADPVFQDYSSFWRMLRRKMAYELNYTNIVPYFEQTETFTETTCPPPDTVLSDEQAAFTCQLHFPESELFLELSMRKSSYDNEVWYDVKLVNPNCNCNNN
jgi:hypothetical protein